MTTPHGASDRDLDRSGSKLRRSSWPFFTLGGLLAVAGIVLVIVGEGTAFVIGIVLIALGAPLLALGGSLVLTGGVSWWAARRKPFA